MKVLFLNYEYPPLGGGAANATASLLQEWQGKEGVEVHLVTSSLGPNLEKRLLGKNIILHRVPIGKNPKNLHHQSLGDIVRYSLKGWWYSRKLIRTASPRFDVTLAFFTVPCGFLAMLLKWEFGIPYVVSLRGSDVPGYSRKYVWLYPLLRSIIRTIWRSAVAVAPNSVGLEHLAKETAPNQSFTIIENGVDTQRFVPDVSKRPAKSFIITPGASRITERKGLNYLIEAVAELAPRYPELQLKIMGDGSARSTLEALVRERGLSKRVTFLGRIPRDKTVSYYQEASLFVLPSLNEGMSNAMLEALASGLPILSTPTGGADELVIDGKNGFRIEEKSISALVEGIERFLIDKNLVHEFGEESRRRAERQGWNQVAHSFSEVLERCKVTK